jgi:zinc protease
MKRIFITSLLSLALVSCSEASDNQNSSAESNSPAVDIEISYEKFTLDNGLRVIVHEDRKAPIVAVSVWYHVGSKNEPQGKTGFAHLFEHLMFNGSENYDDEYFGPFEKAGATSMNGTTWFDRTNYFQNVPTPALEMALWMESDRMGHLLGAITQEKLDNQRGVVQNEKRSGDNRPYGRMEYSQLEGLYPVGHPYRHSTIGSMADLDAASLEDVKGWFEQYYGAANTVLVLAGDLDAETGRALAEKYFGDIKSGPPLETTQSMIPDRSANTRETMIDSAVPHRRISRIWAVPGRIDQEATLLSLAADALSGGKNSRLYQELVFKNQLAVSVSADLQPFELTSVFEISVTLQPNSDIAEVEAIVDRVLAEFIKNGPTEAELAKSRTAALASSIRGLEVVGGFMGKATVLAQGELYAHNPGFYKTTLGWVETATPEQVRKSAQNWLSDGYYQLTVLPFEKYSTVETSVDRSKGLPEVGAMPNLVFPKIERAELSNGIKIVLANRTAVPIVNIAIQFDAGYSADRGVKLGTASYTMVMLDEGTATRDALTIASEIEALGANIGTGSNLDASSVTLSALKMNLEPSLDLFADIVMNANFPDGDIERIRPQMLSAIEQEKSRPVNLGLRMLPPLIYGRDHAYGIPRSGSGTPETIAAMSRDDMLSFKDNWLRPDNATILIAGDVTMDEAVALLEARFGSWLAPSGEKPVKNLHEVAKPEQARVIILDKPDAPQSLILAGHVLPAAGDVRNLKINTMNSILGGEFTARINMNLREDKGWSYGAFTVNFDAKGQGMFLVYAPVQTDKTKESIIELVNEIDGFLGDNPATSDELAKVVANNVNRLPGAYETAGAVLRSLTSNLTFARPDDYVTTLSSRYQELSVADIEQAASDVLAPKQLVWLIVGDKDKIADDVRSLNLGPVEIWDKDGNPIVE